MENSKIKYKIADAEGAFYGPKIEAHIKDSQGRDWQLGTVQLDLVMLPDKFELAYIDENGNKQKPFVIHRAVFGSFERFTGILLEHFDGALPFWLSPTQVAVLAINDKVLDYANQIAGELKEKNIRVELDSRNETIGKKIRNAEVEKISYILVIGDKEEKNGTVSVRERGKGDLGAQKLEKFKSKILFEIEEKI